MLTWECRVSIKMNCDVVSGIVVDAVITNIICFFDLFNYVKDF